MHLKSMQKKVKKRILCSDNGECDEEEFSDVKLYMKVRESNSSDGSCETRKNAYYKSRSSNTKSCLLLQILEH